MKFNIGDVWRTRDGREITITHILENNSQNTVCYPIIGKDKNEYFYSFDLSGKAGDRGYALDLIGLVVNPIEESEYYVGQKLWGVWTGTEYTIIGIDPYKTPKTYILCHSQGLASWVKEDVDRYYTMTPPKVKKKIRETVYLSISKENGNHQYYNCKLSDIVKHRFKVFNHPIEIDTEVEIPNE